MKKNTQNTILKILARKKAVSVNILKNQTHEALNETDIPSARTGAPSAILRTSSAKPKYAATRAIKHLIDSGLAEVFVTGQNDYMRLTASGRQKLYREELGSTTTPIPAGWDGKWRMIILDLPEDRKNEREALRYLLKKAGFVCAKNSVWVSPFPFEHFFTNIKKDLRLTYEMLIITTEKLDEATERFFLENFKK